jgi:hypothetical protein
MGSDEAVRRRNLDPPPRRATPRRNLTGSWQPFGATRSGGTIARPLLGRTAASGRSRASEPTSKRHIRASSAKLCGELGVALLPLTPGRFGVLFIPLIERHHVQGAQARGEGGVEDLRSRGAPLEYWFVKVSSGDLAFLVDWIVRRDSARAEVRISMWVRRIGRVLRSQSGVWREDATTVEICGCTLTPVHGTGEVEDVRWDLACAPGRWMLQPAPVLARLLHPFDLELVARPRARFSGAVTVGGETFRVDDAAGTLVHYWGRRLPDAWLWVSADGVGEHDAAVEAALFHSRLWGAPKPAVAAGYVAVNDRGRTSQIIAPVYGRVTARGNETAFEMRARTWGRSVHLTARSPSATYNDLGGGIRQTLLGDLTVEGWGSCSGRAGLEVRGDAITVEDRDA